MKEFVKQHKVLIIFGLFLLFLILQHQLLWLFFDDYGYGSLTYLTGFVPKNSMGYMTSLPDILAFLAYHYQNWGGRILYFFFECLFLRGNLFWFRLCQSIIITLIFYYLYKIIAKSLKKESSILAIMCILCYGIFEIMVFRGGFFWITASVLYVWPMLALLIFVYYYSFKEDKNFSLLKKALIGLCVFMATFSQEQISVLTVGYLVICLIYKVVKKEKITKYDLFLLFIGILGFLILMLAPGNSIRMQHPTSASFYALSLSGKLLQNIPQIIIHNFNSETKIFSIFFFLSMMSLGILNIKENNGYKYLNIISLLSIGVIMLFSFYLQDGYFSYFYGLFGGLKQILILGVFLIQLLLIVYSLWVYFYRHDKRLLFLFIGALASQGCMLLAPYFPHRSVICFEFVCFLLMLYLLFTVINTLKINYLKNTLLIIIASLCLFNVAHITIGYFKNQQVSYNNDKILREASREIKLGKVINKIHLQKIPLYLYACDLPYVTGNEYIYTYMKNYYDLPSYVQIIYD